MRTLSKLLLTIGLIMTLSEGAQAGDPENTLVMETEHGTVVIEMLPDVAPKHVARIKELTREGFYDGVVFHRDPCSSRSHLGPGSENREESRYGVAASQR